MRHNKAPLPVLPAPAVLAVFGRFGVLSVGAFLIVNRLTYEQLLICNSSVLYNIYIV